MPHSILLIYKHKRHQMAMIITRKNSNDKYINLQSLKQSSTKRKVPQILLNQQI